MDYAEFVEKASRTKAEGWHLENLNQGLIAPVLAEFIRAGHNLDRLKKALFYGTPSRLEAFNDMIDDSGRCAKIPITEFSQSDMDTIHSLLGIATESVELIEALQKYLYVTGKLDHVNLKEEIGDIEWYKALLVTNEAELSGILGRVISKLSLRFPEKFSATRSEDENRDLSSEREILENDHQ